MVKEKFQQYLEKIKDFNILVIGDLMLDKWEYYKSNRLSQEAPVPIVFPEREEFVLGGAGNVTKNLSLLGCKTCLFSLLGSDKYSSLLYNNLLKELNNTEFYYISDSRINTLKRRLIVDNQHFLRIDDENSKDISEYLEGEFFKSFINILKVKNFNAIILQDYGKGLLTNRVIRFIMQESHKKNIKVYIDPKKNKYFRDAWLIKPNKKELLEISSVDITNNKSIFQWLKYNNIKNLLLTQSEEGMTLFTANEELIEFKDKFIYNNPIDVTGAGDIVIALYTLLDLLNIDNYEKLYLTSIAAQTAIIKRGTSTIDLQEINKILFQTLFTK